MTATTNQISPAGTVVDLVDAALRGELGPNPADISARSVFWIQHGTRLASGNQLYRNRYVLVRVESAFGACAFEAGQLDPDIAELSGESLASLMRRGPEPLRLAALDGYLGFLYPHRNDARAEIVTLPTGTPDQRAEARDAAITGLLDISRGPKVALIGVVNPLIAAINDAGGTCLPCDLNLSVTAWGDPISADMHHVLEQADQVVATGMTLGNGSFDVIRSHCLAKDKPLTIYAQSSAAVARHFLGRGVTALSAEHFPFSQFSVDETSLYRYRADFHGAGVRTN